MKVDVSRLIENGRHCQAVEDSLARWKRKHGDHHPGDIVRRAQPTIVRFDEATTALLKVLRTDFDDAPIAVDISALAPGSVELVDVLIRVQQALRASDVLANPGPGRRGKVGTGWRERLRRELMAAGLTQKDARARTKPEALRRTK